MGKKRIDWTDEQRATADRMQAEACWSSEEIGRAVGRSAKAVRQYFYRENGLKDSVRMASPPDHVDYMPRCDAEAFARAMARGGRMYGPGAVIDPYHAPVSAAYMKCAPQTQTYGGVTSEW